MTEKSRFVIITTVFIVLALALAGVIGIYSLTSPGVLPVDAPPSEFSAERAMKHVSAIAQEPHPVGSLANEQVADYIVAQLEAMGLSPEVRPAATVVTLREIRAASVRNIIAKIPGTDPSKAIALDAHYDSMPFTPGASDDGSAVATLLETARALKASPTLQNDVILIFTDSEEFGPGLGAAAFLEEHPLAQEIGLVLNFEAIGKTGPSLMFETGPDSGWLVREFGRVASHPVAQSWVYEIYRLTPVGTDLTEYINAGIAGLNFIYLEEGTAYHTMLDNPETIDPRSLQHHGAYALTLTRHLGNIDLEDAQATSSGDVIYFTLFSGLLVSYPTTLVMPLVVLAALALIGVSFIGFRRRQLNIRHVFLGLLAFSVSVIAAVGLVFGILNLVIGLHEEYQAMFILGRIYNANIYMFAFIALAIAVITTVHVIFRRWVKVTDLTLGVLLFWWIMAVGGSLFVPGFSYLFTWPLLFSTLALGWVLWREPMEEHSLQRLIIPTVGVIPGIILFVPSIVVMFHYAPTTLIFSSVFFAMLLLGLLIPQIDLITRTRKWWLPGIALLVTVGFLVAGSLTAGFDTEHPRPNAVAYMLNADTGQATWFSPGTRPDTWTSQFLSEEPEHGTLGELFPLTLRSRLTIMKNEAPAIPLDGPEVEILDDQTVNGLRTLKLRLSSPRQAPIITLDMKPYAVVKGVMVDGQRTDNPKEGRSGLWSLIYYAVPSKGVEITLEVEPGQEFTIQITDQSFELPTIPGTTFKPRSDDMMPANFNYGTVVVRSLVFR